MNKPKALIITRYFPPSAGGASMVMYNLCKYLPSENFCIISARRGDYGVVDDNFYLNCNIIRMHWIEIIDTIKIPIFLLIYTLYLILFKGIILIKKEKINCILGVYPSFCGILSAYILHKITRKPLIVYMHDLFSESLTDKSHMSNLERKFWSSIEQKIFLSASKIFVPTERFRKHYEKRGMENVVVFPHSIDPKETKTFDVDNEKLKIVFTGEVYHAHEDSVRKFIEATKYISDIDVVFATPSNLDYLQEVSVGFLSRDKCIDLQRSADVLFLPLAFDSPYPKEIMAVLPSKTLEYLAAGKPILAVVPKGSYVEEFIEENDVGIVVNELSQDKIIDAINKLKDEKLRKKFSNNALECVKKFDAKKRADELLSILKELYPR